MVEIKNPLYKEDMERIFPQLDRMFGGETKKILVAGATGLIGSFLVDAMLYYNQVKGERAYVYALARSRERLEARFSGWHSDRLHLLEQDIREPLRTKENFDYIFHLASNADPGTYKKYPYETIAANLLGTKNLIDYAVANKFVRIVFTSTMEVYGEIQREALRETDYGAISFNEQRAGYPESKRVSELMYRSAAAEYGIHAVIVRLGYIYGPTMTDSDNKIIAEFLRKKKLGEKGELRSAGTQKRTYCYVADAVKGILIALLNGENAQVYNVANAKEKVTLKELSDIFGFLQENGEKAETSDKVYDTVLDTGRIEKLGFCAEVDLKEGIERSVELYIP